MENVPGSQDLDAKPEPAAVPPASPDPTPRYVEARQLESDERRYSPFAPLLLLALTAISWPVYQFYQLFNEKSAMATIHANQVKPFDDATKLRTALDLLARDTATLAANGNASAKLIVDELAKRGVTIDTSKPPAQPPTPPAQPPTPAPK